MAKTKSKQRERANEDSFETQKTTKSLGKGLVDSFKNDLLKASPSTFWEQLLTVKGEKDQKTAGDMSEGEEISFKREQIVKEAKKNAQIEAGINYKQEIIHATERIRRGQTQEIAVRVEEIVIELKKLAKSSKTLEAQFKTITTVTMPKKPGKYHQNFFEWMFNVVKSARTRVESAENWLKAIAGKGKGKDYWSQYKKHGTSYGLSGERAVAQQTG